MASGGLSHALRTLCAQANTHDNIHCHLKMPRAVRIRDEMVALNLYRIAQEAVGNAVKHARATEITVCIERERDHVRLVVEDDGKGFTKKKRSTGMGLHIMQYRASVLGGHFSIERRPKDGTRVVAEVPLKKNQGTG
jgi:two-component system CheB/CheR fusion protein